MPNLQRLPVTIQTVIHTVEYAKSSPVESDNTDDTYHLLWSSDRLEIARQIDSRLTKIFADLVSLEKMMHYKHSIIDILRSVAPPLNDEQGRRQTLIEQVQETMVATCSR